MTQPLTSHRLLAAILFLFIGTQFIGPNATTVSASTQPNTVTDTSPGKHSTACDPLPWNRNPELAAMGYEIRNVWFTTESRDIFTQQSGAYVRTTEDLVLHFDIRRLYPTLSNSKLITKIDTGGSVWEKQIPRKPFAQYTGADWKLLWGIAKQDSLMLYDSGLRFFLTNEWDGAIASFEPEWIRESSWKKPKARERLSPLFTPLQDYRYKVVVPKNTNMYTIAIASGQRGLSFVKIPREEFVAPEVLRNDTPTDLKQNCSTIANPYSNKTVLTDGTWQIESLGTLAGDTVSKILSQYPNLFPPFPGKHYEVARFLIRNISPNSVSVELNEVVGHHFKHYRTSPFSADLLTDKGTVLINRGMLGEYVEQVLFPFASVIVHEVYLVPDNEAPSVIAICIACSSKRNGAEKQYVAYSNIFSSVNVSRRDETKHNTRTTRAVRIGETAFGKSYSLKINQLVYGYDAIKFLCRVSECSGEFLTKMDNFQRAEQVDFTLAKITLNFNDGLISLDEQQNFLINNLSIRLVGSARCTQMPYEVAGPIRVLSTTRVNAKESCRVSTPENIHGYNFPQFVEVLHFDETYVSGTAVSGWVRFWIPRKSGNKVIVIDPFKIDRFSKLSFYSLSSTGSEINHYFPTGPGCSKMNVAMQHLWNTNPRAVPDYDTDGQEFLCLPDGKVQSDDVVYFHYR